MVVAKVEVTITCQVEPAVFIHYMDCYWLMIYARLTWSGLLQ